MTLTRTFAAGTLMLAACGGEASLGDNAGETWGGPPEDEASTEAVTTLYSGKRKVHTFTVDDGTLYALVGTRTGFELTTELVACAVDDCTNERRTLWRETAPSPSFQSLVVSSSELFWVDTAELGVRVVACSIDGCPRGPRTVGWLGTTSLITADADFVYWLDGAQRLVRCSHAGCPTAEPPHPNEMELPSPTGGGDQLVAFGEWIYAHGGRRIVRWGKDGREQEVLYDSPFPLSLFDVDAEGIHFATAILTGEVKRCPLSGACGSGEVRAVAQRWPTVVKAAPEGVAWVNSVPEASMFMRLHDDDEPSELAPQTGTLGSVVVSDGYLYWSEQLFPSDIDQINRVAL